MEVSTSSDLQSTSLLCVVSAGHAAIAEVRRMSKLVPPSYSSSPSSSSSASTSAPELSSLDFSYFRHPEQTDHRVESSPHLSAADGRLRKENLAALQDFYGLFAGVRKVGLDLRRAAEAMGDEALQDQHGRQLMAVSDDTCEALYVYGCLLLLLDSHIEGPVRERLLVAFYRYAGQDQHVAADEAGSIDDICQLMRSTGYSCSSRRPAGYPESLFGRLQPPGGFVRGVLGRLRSEDLYERVARCYPDPDHRSTALSEQAAMLFVCLFFSPDTLKNDQNLMREIVDRFFSDNWVVSFYMGSLANLIEWWEPYKAAKAALSTTYQQANVKELSVRHREKVQSVSEDTDKLVNEGAVSEESFLDHIVKVLNLLRDSNVALRWTLLHTAPLGQGAEQVRRCRQCREQVLSDFRLSTTSASVSKGKHHHHLSPTFKLLLNTAELESRLRTMYSGALAGRERAWERTKTECRERMRELADFYSGEQTLFGRAPARDEKLQSLFLSAESTLADSSSSSSSLFRYDPRSAVLALVEIDRAAEFEAVEANLQVKKSLKDAKEGLHHLIRLAGIKEEVLVTLQVIIDMSYAWGGTVDAAFTDLMREGIRDDPALVGRLRAMFIKLSYALDGPAFRISQSGDPAAISDLAAVSGFYSSELVDYLARVLQVIPETVFDLLDRIERLRSQEMVAMPARVDREKMREMAQFKQRFQLAKLTNSVSIFAEGMLDLKSTLIGVIQLDPERLLDEGLRRELSRLILEAVETELTFSGSKSKDPGLLERLDLLGVRLRGLHSSLEAAQDLIGVNGLRMWAEELGLVVETALDREEEEISRNSRDAEREEEEDSAGKKRRSFLGRLCDELIRVTSPRNTVFVPSVLSWFDSRHSHLENFSECVCATDLTAALESAVHVAGVCALDRLLGLRAVAVLAEKVFGVLDSTLRRDRSWSDAVDNLGNSLNPVENVIAQPAKFYSTFTGKSPKLLNSLVDSIVSVGQLQLLRGQMAHRLSLSANFDAKNLYTSLKTMNQAVMLSMKKVLEDGDKRNSKNKRSPLLFELSSHLQRCGLSECGHQVYVNVRPPPNSAELLFLVVITALSKATYCSQAGGLIGKKHQDPLDGHVFTLGFACVLRQCPNSVADAVVAYLAQYIRSFSEAASLSTSSALSDPSSSHETQTAAVFLETLSAARKEAATAAAAHLPSEAQTEFATAAKSRTS